MKKTDKEDSLDYNKYLSGKATKNTAADPAPETAPVGEVTMTPDTPDNESAKSRNSRATKRKNPRPKKPDAVDTIKNALDEALDEDVAEIAEFSVTKNIEEEPVLRKQNFKRSLYFVVGIAVSIMSVIGFISTIIFFSDVVAGIAGNTKQKEELADYIYPIVIVDPAPFEQSSQMSSDMIIGSAIWDIILHGDVSKYPEEFGTMTVPQLDVEQHATSLFGTGLTFDHKTMGDAALTFYYTEETKSYNVPVSPKYFPYSPKVENIKKEGNVYHLRVGYVSPSPAWLIQNKDSGVVPDKYMEYILEKSGTHYTVTGVKDLYDNNHIPDEE